jgi:hypothetical protein
MPAYILHPSGSHGTYKLVVRAGVENTKISILDAAFSLLSGSPIAASILRHLSKRRWILMQSISKYSHKIQLATISHDVSAFMFNTPRVISSSPQVLASLATQSATLMRFKLINGDIRQDINNSHKYVHSI